MDAQSIVALWDSIIGSLVPASHRHKLLVEPTSALATDDKSRRQRKRTSENAR